MKEVKLSPSILSADFANLEREIRLLESADIERVHLDVMDGHFVPNITFGPPLVKCIREKTDLILESHLMISDPAKYIEPFREAGSDIIIIHQEAISNHKELLIKIKELGAVPGISINPGTPWETIKDLLEYIDIVLVMTVNPGFGGQKFMPEVLDKMRELNEYIKEKNLNIEIEVDGGINKDNISLATQAGASLIVAGASIFSTSDPLEAINILRENIVD